MGILLTLKVEAPDNLSNTEYTTWLDRYVPLMNRYLYRSVSQYAIDRDVDY